MYLIQDIFNKFGNKYLSKYNLCYYKLNVYNKICMCRIPKQDVRIYKCHDCGKKKYVYKSCLDRHCSICLEYKKELWIEKHKQDILVI